MADNLDEFISEDANDTRTSHVSSIHRELVLFRYGGEVYALNTELVDSIVPWREPVPLPRVNRAVRGVIQERGRIVIVLSHPAALTISDTSVPVRTIVCNTPLGFLGLPAAETLRLGSVRLYGHPTPGQVVDSEAGLLNVLDPEQSYRAVLGTA